MEIREYLTYDEINIIVTQCLAIDNPVERDFVKWMYILKFVTELDISDEVSSEEFDKYTQDGTIEEVGKKVKNIGNIDKFIAEAESVQKTMIKAELIFEEFLLGASNTIDKVTKGLPKSAKGWDSMLNKFKGVIENGNKNTD